MRSMNAPFAILFDVNPFKKGIMEPNEFINLFGELGIPKVLYYGKANSFFEEAVRRSELDGMTFEGVICKAKNPQRTPLPVMFKIKSHAWLKQLKEFCKDDESLYKELE